MSTEKNTGLGCAHLRLERIIKKTRRGKLLDLTRCLTCKAVYIETNIGFSKVRSTNFDNLAKALRVLDPSWFAVLLAKFKQKWYAKRLQKRERG